MRKAILIAAVSVMGALPVVADQAPVTPPMTARLGALRAAQASDPYAKLFEVRSALGQAIEQRPQKAVAPKKRIVCGMTIVEVGPELDPKMGVTPPKDDKGRYTIRAVEPAVCNSSASR
jgi:hypothetical protein